MNKLLIFGLGATATYLWLSNQEKKEAAQPQGSDLTKPPAAALVTVTVTDNPVKDEIVTLPPNVAVAEGVAAFDGGANRVSARQSINRMYKVYDASKAATVSPRRVRITFEK